MSRNAHNLIQRITAGFFLAVFLFISIAKFVHHHDSTDTDPVTKTAGKQVASSSSCSICDYHFTKDAVDEAPVAFTHASEVVSVLYTDYLSQRLTSIGLTSSGRGPPALI